MSSFDLTDNQNAFKNRYQAMLLVVPFLNLQTGKRIVNNVMSAIYIKPKQEERTVSNDI